MNKLTLVIDHWENIELKEYLLSLNGIHNVIINNQKQLEVLIKYNSNLISAKTIKSEILLFLDIVKIPSILAFDKHSNNKLLEYKIIKNEVCCEYCLKSTIEDLLEFDGIEKVNSNFDRENYDIRNGVIININFNEDLISVEDLKQIESKLNI